MKTNSILLIMIFSWGFYTCNAQNNINTLTQKVMQAQDALAQHPKDRPAWQQLHALINDNYVQFSAAERTRFRSILEKYGSWSSGTLYTTAEPGTKILIKGSIIDASGKPVANAALHIFQTDSHGYYTPLDSIERKMGEPDARLFCFLTTDNEGNFEIHTVRPASYPMQYKGRTIPQHIHLNITAQGYQSKKLQMLFTDDPAMDDYWRQWAGQNKYPILTLNNALPEHTATIEITLTQ
jgi:protocatechuate 3,4-dioxygenase beta subunit